MTPPPLDDNATGDARVQQINHEHGGRGGEGTTKGAKVSMDLAHPPFDFAKLDEVVINGERFVRSIPASAATEVGSALDGVARIAAERARQISVEGWSAAHDDGHDAEELARAAACYAVGENLPIYRGTLNGVGFEDSPRVRYLWPWEEEWWKLAKDPVRNLEKAGALIAAEIDRLLRKKAREEEKAREGAKAAKEAKAGVVIVWNDVRGELPDADLTVLVGFEDVEVGRGYFDGEGWCDAVSGSRFGPAETVAFWADLPAVPVRDLHDKDCSSLKAGGGDCDCVKRIPQQTQSAEEAK